MNSPLNYDDFPQWKGNRYLVNSAMRKVPSNRRFIYYAKAILSYLKSCTFCQ